MLPIQPRFYSTNEKNPSKKIKFIKPSSDNCFLDKDTNIEYVKTYGKWKCLNCENKWYSAYSWLSLIFCNKNKNICRDNIYQEESKSKKIKLVFSGSKLKDKDFLLQECKKCNNNKVKIISYSNLEGGYGDKYIPHRSDLCFKCKKGFPCKKYFSTLSKFKGVTRWSLPDNLILVWNYDNKRKYHTKCSFNFCAKRVTLNSCANYKNIDGFYHQDFYNK